MPQALQTRVMQTLNPTNQHQTNKPLLFAGKYLLLKVQKRPGKESEPLLPAADDMNAVAASAAAAKASNGINVFTVASGHMYERLQKIMILSVIKNTKSRYDVMAYVCSLCSMSSVRCKQEIIQ